MNADLNVGDCLRVRLVRGHAHIERDGPRPFTRAVYRELANLVSVYRRVGGRPPLYAVLPKGAERARRLAVRLGFRETRLGTPDGARMLCLK